MRNEKRWLISFLMVLVGCQQTPEKQETFDQEQFAKHIRTTDPNTPQAQLQSFQVPTGFKIQLFAAEPDIGKPMNISFDARGRLWVTQSRAYPFADSSGTADRITILEDSNHDGRADKFTTFADSLNIPIGIVPVSDGAIAFSIPYVYHLVDSDGDDRVDQRKILLRGFEYRDTHGMINNFFRGLDGWIHADHGFSNVSEVVGTDNKPPLRMQSGNTFRFRIDGSGVEFTTTGRVNPFGYALDEYGYMYSVDCHSSPIYQLIRGADYPHFGKKPTGIGFGPAMMPHNYGSTALAGLDYYTGGQFPEAYQQSFYLGDVVKSRVYQATIDMAGTTPVPTWEQDFIISEDPWFRPVDVKLGPDGALYIADFYNRIIGHYEVPLDHPGRDRERGRIWRVSYEDNADPHRSVDWSNRGLPELISGLKNPSLSTRMMVADQIVDRFGGQAVTTVLELLQNPQATAEQVIHGMWILYRLEKLDRSVIDWALAHHNNLVQIHLLHILFEMDQLEDPLLDRLVHLMGQGNPHISRAVIMILAKHPSFEQLELLLTHKAEVPEQDTHLAYCIKQALRDHLRHQEILSGVYQSEWRKDQLLSIAEAIVGVDQAQSAQFLANNLEHFNQQPVQLVTYVNHIARLLPETELAPFELELRSLTTDNMDLQYKVLRSLQNGLAQRGGSLDYGKDWAIELATILLEYPSVSENPGDELSDTDKQQVFACEVAGDYQVRNLQSNLLDLLNSKQTNHQVRLAAARSLLTISGNNFQSVATVATDEQEKDLVREPLHLALVAQKTEEAFTLATSSMNGLSFDTQKKMVLSMSTDTQGIEQVLQAARSMSISPKMLLEPSIQTTLEGHMTDQQQLDYQELTKDLIPFSQETQRLINERLATFETAPKSVRTGSEVYNQHCASCHQIGGAGGNIGPQLDGIGNRGPAALTEKILDPNRNISKSFVNYAIQLKDGTSKQGLFRRNEGNLKVYADLTGLEFSLSIGDIESEAPLPYTLMPDNFSKTIPESDYYHLLHYLVEQK